MAGSAIALHDRAQLSSRDQDGSEEYGWIWHVLADGAVGDTPSAQREHSGDSRTTPGPLLSLRITRAGRWAAVTAAAA